MRPGCRKAEQGKHRYNGRVHTTKDGRECARWDRLAAGKVKTVKASGQGQNFVDGSLKGASNYCRNPIPGNHSGAWCYLLDATDANNFWGDCDIPLCNGECER